MTSTAKTLVAVEELLAGNLPLGRLLPVAANQAGGDRDVSNWVGYESTHPLTWLLDAAATRGCHCFN